MNRIGISVNKGKPKARVVARQLVWLIEERGAEVYLEPDIAAEMDRPELGLPSISFPTGSISSSFSAETGRFWGSPGASPNPGSHPGVQSGPSRVFVGGGAGQSIQRCGTGLAGDYIIEERMMLDAEVIRDGRVMETSVALNDVGIAKGSFSRMITCTVLWTAPIWAPTPGDGLIVSTPTGSTGLFPFLRGTHRVAGAPKLLLTPICPHYLDGPADGSPARRYIGNPRQFHASGHGIDH